jgi:hypothetical protein
VGRSISRQRVDDIDGSRPAQTVAFALDGQRFEIDLSDARAATLRGAFAPYIAAGRTAGRRRSAAHTQRSTTVAVDSPSRRASARSSAAAPTPADGPPSTQVLPTEQSTVAPAGAESLERRTRWTSATVEIEDRPLAVVVPLPCRPQVGIGGSDIAALRVRLATEVGELTRVLAVAVLAAATDRLIRAIVKPTNVPASRESSEFVSATLRT